MGPIRFELKPKERKLQFYRPPTSFTLLTNILSAGTFGTSSVPQRLKNQLLYHEILLLRKFNDRNFQKNSFSSFEIMEAVTILRTDISSSRTRFEGLDF